MPRQGHGCGGETIATSGLAPRKIEVDTAGIAALSHVWKCPAPETCTGSEILFFDRTGAPAASPIHIDDPLYISYFSGIEDFALNNGTLYVTRGSGDYHDEVGSISAFGVPALSTNYGVSIAAG